MRKVQLGDCNLFKEQPFCFGTGKSCEGFGTLWIIKKDDELLFALHKVN